MKLHTPVTFPSQELAAHLAAAGIKINSPLFHKYALPDGMSEQVLQDTVKSFNTDYAPVMLIQLAQKIKQLNPEIADIEIPENSMPDLTALLMGIASRFTTRDIKYFIKRNNMNEQSETYKMDEASRMIKERKVKKHIGHFTNFVMDPKIFDEIIDVIDIRAGHPNKMERYIQWQKERGIYGD